MTIVATSSIVLVERRERVAVLWLNRPDSANSLSDALVAALLVELDAVAADDSIDAVVISGSGKAFCSGGDLVMLQRWQLLPARGRVAEYKTNQRLARRLLTFPMGVVAAVNGAAAGAGFDLMLCADVCVAAESASFKAAFTSVGLVPDLGGSWLLPRIIGLSRARQLLLTGRVLDAATALDWGLVAEVVPNEQLIEAAVDVAAAMARSSALPALGEVKQALVAGAVESYDDSLTRAAVAQSLLMDTVEHRERTERFLNPRRT